MYWTNLLFNLGWIGLVIWGIIWLVRELAKLSLSKDLEEFKSDLKIEAEKSRIQYEKLHNERAEVIKNLYQKMTKAHRSFSSLMNPLQLAGEPKEEEKAKKAARLANDMTRYYERNKIFLKESEIKNVDDVMDKFRDAWRDFNYSRDVQGSEPKEYRKAWRKAWKAIDKEIPKAKKSLEKSFREALGIDEN